MTTTVEQRDLVVHSGYATASTCRIVVVSNYPQPVELFIDNTYVDLKLAVMGDDIAPFFPANIGVQQAGYYKHYEVTKLPTRLTDYEFTATQRNTPNGTLTFNGTLQTAPGENDDFAVVMFSCSGRIIKNQGGAWNAVKRYKEKEPTINPDGLPLSMVYGVDDITYIDNHAIDDTAFPIPHNANAVVTDAWFETSYLACVKWMSWAGMTHNLTDFATDSGREYTHTWCKDHINRVGIWGDHEIFNDVGYGVGSGTYRLDSVTAPAQTVGKFKTMQTAWDIFFTYTNGPGHFNLDGNELNPTVEGRSRGWAFDYGPLQLIALDRNYGDLDNREGNGRFIYSQAQIDGVNNALVNSNARFRLIGSAHKYKFDDVANGFDIVDDDNAAHGVFTHSTNMSLMKKHNTDGSKFLFFQGDNHTPGLVNQHGTDVAGREKEDFVVFNVAGMRTPQGGMAGINLNYDTDKGWYDWNAADFLPPVGIGVNPEWRGMWDNTIDLTTTKLNIEFEEQGEGVFLLVECYASETPKRWVISIVWGGSNKRQVVYEYIDDNGANVPTPRKNLTMR